MRLLYLSVISTFIILIAIPEIENLQKQISNVKNFTISLCHKGKLPKIENGRLLKFVRFKSKRKNIRRVTVAIFLCEEGFHFAKNSSQRMFCKNSKWIGKIPICEENKYFNTSSDNINPLFPTHDSNKTVTETILNFNTNITELSITYDIFKYGVTENVITSPTSTEKTFVKTDFLLNNSELAIDSLDNSTVYARNDRDNVNNLHTSEILCVNRFIDSSQHLECVCPEGYILSSDGETCKDIDECKINNHNCHQICINLPGAFKCACNLGFTLGNNKASCEDIDECRIQKNSKKCIDFNDCNSSVTINNCSNIDECLLENNKYICSQRCVNTYGSYYCSCYQGYTLDVDNKTCNDINECIENPCSQKCVNTQGSFACRCNKGFKLSSDNRTCEDINECTTRNGNCSHLCGNLEGSYACACPKGFVLSNDGKNCKKAYACSINNGGCSHFCSDFNDSPKCSCPYDMELIDGFNCIKRKQCSTKRKDECYSCNVGEKILLCFCPLSDMEYNRKLTCPQNYEFFNEVVCRTMNPNICKRYNKNGISKECLILEETKACLCPEDFYIKDGECVSFDPCFINNGGCSHICENVDGKPICRCPEGLILRNNSCLKEYTCDYENGRCSHYCKEFQNEIKCSCPKGLHLIDKKNCIEYNPCLKDNGGCSHICKNINGKALCKCPEGFIMKSKTCQSLNSCAYNNGGCSHFCIDSFNGPKCSCPNYFTLIGKNCSEHNLCELDNGGCSHFCNITEDKNYFCSCKRGFQIGPDRKSCEDIDECRTEPKICSHNCTNIDGAYICSCSYGFKLSSDGRNCSRISICPPLIAPDHGQMFCSENQDGIMRCSFSCEKGYEIHGEKIIACEFSGRWTANVPVCIREENTTGIYMECPNDGILNFTLPPGQSSMNVRFSRPKTSVDWWRHVSSVPFWGKYLNRHLPVGKTKITFTAYDDKRNLTASCNLVINILDNDSLKVYNCPSDIYDVLPKSRKSKSIAWQEPIFVGNVKVVSISKSKIPGTEFYLGKEEVVYTAKDEANNEAKCKFFVELKEASQKNTKSYFYKNVLICPSGVTHMSESPDYYDFNTIRRYGCHWKFAKVDGTRPKTWYFRRKYRRNNNNIK